jgi:hypothetical protein
MLCMVPLPASGEDLIPQKVQITSACFCACAGTAIGLAIRTARAAKTRIISLRQGPITDKENLWLLDLSTGGRVTIWLRPDVAPKMVERIKQPIRAHAADS